MNGHPIKENMEFTRSTGNVFEDLELENPEEEVAKAKLAQNIRGLIKEMGLTQNDAASRLATNQSEVSKIMNGKVSQFTIDRLLRFLRALDRRVEIVVTENTQANHGLSVTTF